MDTVLHRDGEDLGPRQMVQGDLAKLASVNVEWVHARGRRHLVRDGEDRVESVIASHVEVALDLGRLELGGAGLHLHKARPGLAGPGGLEDTVGIDGAVTERERHLDVRG